jgi:hypothetical protein
MFINILESMIKVLQPFSNHQEVILQLSWSKGHNIAALSRTQTKPDRVFVTSITLRHVVTKS